MKFSNIVFLIGLAGLLVMGCAEEQYITEPGKLVPQTVKEDPSLPAISVNGALLHSEAFGHPDSSIVVCIHGGPGGDYRSLLNCSDLAEEGYRVVFYDQRGSGLSQRFPRKSYTDLGLDVLDLMYDELSGVIAHYRTHEDQKVFLLGHSWGAILATGYAGRYPDAIQGMVLCEPGGLEWDDIVEYVKESRSFDLWSEEMNDAVYQDQFITGKEDQHEILDYKMAMLASKNPITGEDNTKPGSFWRSGAVINSAFNEIGEEYEPDFSQGIDQYDVPVLFIYSEENKAYPDAWAQKISSAYNHVELIKVDGVGHDGIISDDHAWDDVTLPGIRSYFYDLR